MVASHRKKILIVAQWGKKRNYTSHQDREGGGSSDYYLIGSVQYPKEEIKKPR